MVVARRRRRRRPILLVLALLVTVVVAVAYASRSSSNGPDRRLGWLDEVRPAVEQSNQLGRELADLRDQVRDLDRPTLTRRVQRLAGEARALQRQVLTTDPPESLETARGLLLACFAIRTTAITELKPAFDAALGTGPVDDAAAALARVGDDLAVGDRTYEVFLGGLPRYRQPVAVPSVWADDPTIWKAEELRAFVATLRSSASLAPVHDLAVVTVSTDPPATGKDPSGADVLPFVKALRLQVVVANVGNETEKRVTVVGSVGAPGSPTPDTARQFVDLAPGQRQVVQLGGLGPVANTPMVLSVRVEPVTGESNVADNEVDRNVVFR